jgi:hypothetical protein
VVEERTKWRRGRSGGEDEAEEGTKRHKSLRRPCCVALIEAIRNLYGLFVSSLSRSAAKRLLAGYTPKETSYDIKRGNYLRGVGRVEQALQRKAAWHSGDAGSNNTELMRNQTLGPFVSPQSRALARTASSTTD